MPEQHRPEQHRPGLAGRVGTVLFAVDGEVAGLVHRSVLDRTAEFAGRLGCPGAIELCHLPASFDAVGVRRLRRDLEQVIAFADAARRTGWVLGELTAAPGDQAVAVLDDPRGLVWAHPVRGFELHTRSGVQRITELPQVPGAVARRVPLIRLLAPLAEAAARARLLEVFEPEVYEPGMQKPGVQQPGVQEPEG